MEEMIVYAHLEWAVYVDCCNCGCEINLPRETVAGDIIACPWCGEEMKVREVVELSPPSDRL